MLALFSPLLIGSAAFAQQPAPAPAAAPAADDEVVELSLFQVTTDNDTGYKASSTLAGSQLRTDLKDVAASISVVTKDLMSDINANNLETLMNYTTGTEGTGIGGNYYGAVAGGAGDLDNGSGLREPQTRIRIRGLADADQTRDFFLTTVSNDGYNIERFEISRGANAILFGLGSPAGIVNAGLISAKTNKTKNVYELQVDNFGSIRHTIDTNQVIIKNKLAVRVAGLLGDREYKQKPAFTHDKRLTATLTYKPWEGATFRAIGEAARQESNRPQNRPPFDFITQWWAVGKPVYSVVGGVPSVNLTGTPVNSYINAGNVTDRWGYGTGVNLILANPNNETIGQLYTVTGTPSSAFAQGSFTSPQFNWDGTLRRLGGGYPDYNRTLTARINQSNANTDLDPNYKFWRHPQLTDSSIFDFYNNLLEGPNKREWLFFDTFNASFEQRLGRNAGIELTYDKQSTENGYINPFNFTDGYAIHLDINQHLPTGQLNPNFGRPYINNNSWQGSAADERDAFRVKAYYDLDLARVLNNKLGKILGRHTLNGVYTDQSREEKSYGGRPYVLGLDYVQATAAQNRIPGWQNLSLSGGADFRMVSRTAYLGRSLATASSAAGAGLSPIGVNFDIDGLNSVSTQWYDSGTNSYSIRNFSVLQTDRYDVSKNTAYGVGTFTKSEIESKILVLTSQWWDKVLVSTLGWREEEFKFFGSNGIGYDANTGLPNVGPEYQRLNSTPNLEGKGSSFSYGLVAHLPKSIEKRLPWGSTISLTYNNSDNFRPSAQEFNIYDRPVDAPTGETKDYGILITTLDGKLDFRVIRYESSIVASRELKDPLRESINELVRFPRDVLGNIAGAPYQALITGSPSLQAGVAAFDTWLTGPVGTQLANTFRYQYGTATNGRRIVNSFSNRINEVTGLTDSVSKGTEYELSYNVNKNWRITANASQQKVSLSNIDPALRQFVTDFSASLKANATLANFPISADPSADTLGQRADKISANLNRTLLKEGQSNSEVRKWRYNLINNYTWYDGALAGWYVGGAVRWQDKATIGYGIKSITDASGTVFVEDVNKPYYGPAETNYDGWVGYSRKLEVSGHNVDWKVQLNARNLGTGDELIPVAANPDGSYSTFRIAEPMTVTLTNTFTF